MHTNVKPELTVTEEHPQTSEFKSMPSITMFDLIRLFYKKRKIIGIITAIVTVASVIYSLFLSPSFKSTSTILPETDKGKLAGLGGLSDIASLAGVGGNDVSPVKLYPTIIKSERVLKNVIFQKYQSIKFSDSVNLIQIWNISGGTQELQYEAALKRLRNDLDVSMDPKTSVITLSLETGEPQLTADIINTVISELDMFMRTKRTTIATKQQQWIEARLGEVKTDLVNSENRVKDFREKNRIVTGSANLMMEQERLLREVQINGMLYTELKKQDEMTKIEVVKNTPIVSILDPAFAAARKERQKRSIIVLAAFFITIFSTSGYFVFDFYYKQPLIKYVKIIQG